MRVVRELGRIAKNLRHQENCGGQPRICGIMCRYVTRELGRTAKKCAHHSLPALVHIHIAETVGRTAKNVPGIILFAESYTAKNDWSWDAAENLEVDQWRNLCLDVG